MKYRAIFFDLDGTLASLKTHTIPDSAKRALAQASSRGVKIFLATGRHPEHFSWGVIDGIAFDGFLTSNGQFCFNDREVIFRKHIAKTDMDGLLSRLREQPYPVLFLREEDTFINMVDDQVREAFAVLRMKVPKVIDPQTLDDPQIFALLLCDGVELDSRTLEVMPGCKDVRWHPAFTDIIPADGGKDAGIDAMLDYYGIALEETMAFGDAQNDLSMLEHVGMGVAMGNAADPVKAVADYVTDHVDEDGVYKALAHFHVI